MVTYQIVKSGMVPGSWDRSSTVYTLTMEVPGYEQKALEPIFEMITLILEKSATLSHTERENLLHAVKRLANGMMS